VIGLARLERWRHEYSPLRSGLRRITVNRKLRFGRQRDNYSGRRCDGRALFGCCLELFAGLRVSAITTATMASIAIASITIATATVAGATLTVAARAAVAAIAVAAMAAVPMAAARAVAPIAGAGTSATAIVTPIGDVTMVHACRSVGAR